MCVYDMFLELGQPCLSICARVKGEAPTSDEAKNCSRFHKSTPVSHFFSAQSWGVDLSFHAGLSGLQTATLPQPSKRVKRFHPSLAWQELKLGVDLSFNAGPRGLQTATLPIKPRLLHSQQPRAQGRVLIAPLLYTAGGWGMRPPRAV